MKKLMLYQNKVSTYADVNVYASWSGDCVNGAKGRAKAKIGGKHYIRSRIRCKENETLKKEIKQLFN